MLRDLDDTYEGSTLHRAQTQSRTQAEELAEKYEELHLNKVQYELAMICIPDRVTQSAVSVEDVEHRGRSVKTESSLFMEYITFWPHTEIKEKEREKADNYGTSLEMLSV